VSLKGFFAEATVQDFRIQGNNVFLYITRRRWLNDDTGKVVTRDWQLVAKGNRITSDFAVFFKIGLLVIMPGIRQLWLSFTL